MTVAAKMRVREGARALFVDAPPEVVATLGLPPLQVGEEWTGEYDHVHAFVHDRARLEERLPRLRPLLGPRSALWTSWPKGRRLGTDLTLPTVIETAYRHRLVESTTLAVDATWSAIRLSLPKPGKTYHNSFGTLPDADPAG